MNYLKEQSARIAPECDSRHIEAYIRLQHPTLGHLDRATIRREIRIARACIAEGGSAAAESCARSFGL